MPICRESETEVVSDLQPMILNKLFPAESEAELSERTSHVYSPALFTRSLQNDRRPQPCEMVVHEGVWQLLIIHIKVQLGKENHVESKRSPKTFTYFTHIYFNAKTCEIGATLLPV